MLFFPSISVHTNNGTTSRNPYGMILKLYFTLDSICMLACFLEMCASRSANDFSFSKTRPLFSSSLKNSLNNPRMGAPSTLIDFMEVGEESHDPTVEIGLDEWMRLSVHSLTPSLKS
jgi:hypothetical protein